MNLTDVLVRYLDFLCKQVERDAEVMNRPWVYIWVLPFIWYFVVCLLKWYILLAPITVPLTFWPTVKQVVGGALSPIWLKGKAEKN